MQSVNFQTLNINELTQLLLSNSAINTLTHSEIHRIYGIKDNPATLKQQWTWIHTQNFTALQSFEHFNSILQKDLAVNECIEPLEVNWLSHVFNQAFQSQNVELVRGGFEPEYIPADAQNPAQIRFAHGYFTSALHEISHWCIAGKRRRNLIDYGYWYAPDGRSIEQQKAFEKVEIKPQALECLLTMMCQKKFNASFDNLNSDQKNQHSTFTIDVYQQATQYIANPNTLPQDAKKLLTILAHLCQDIATLS